MSRRSRPRTDDDDCAPPAIPGSKSMRAKSSNSEKEAVAPTCEAAVSARHTNDKQEDDLVQEKMQLDGAVSGEVAVKEVASGEFEEMVLPDTVARERLRTQDEELLEAKRQAMAPSPSSHQSNDAAATATGSLGVASAARSSSPKPPTEPKDAKNPHLEETAKGPKVTGTVQPGAVAVQGINGEEEKMEEDAPPMAKEFDTTVLKPDSTKAAAYTLGEEDINNREKDHPNVVEHVAGPQFSQHENQGVAVSDAAIAVTADVVPDEEDIEAQVKARVHEEREEIAAQVQQRLLSEAVHADVLTEKDIENNYVRRCKRWMIISGILGLVVVVVVVVVVVLVVGNNDDSSSSSLTNFPTASPTTAPPTPSPTPVPKCTLCADGSVPDGLDSIEYSLGGDGFTCEDFMSRQVLLDAPTDSCIQGQATAWLFCNCPTLPAFPEDATCTICLDGSDPIESPDANVTVTCSDWNTFLAHVGSSPFFDCADLRDIVDYCQCDADPGFEAFLVNLLLPISGEALQTPGTPQNDALNWLTGQDPAGLTSSTSRNEELKQRYVVMVLFFSTGGPSWDNSYGFRSASNVCEWNDASGNGITCNVNDEVEAIELDFNNLNGMIPNEVTTLGALRSIDLRSNEIFGPFPESMGDLSLLERVDVSFNSMSGGIPAAIFGIPTLRELFLDENRFSGPLPATFGNSLTLEAFECRKCSLTGTIPNSVSVLPNLKVLDLTLNEFTGPLPTFAGNTRLEEIYLSNNQLNGTVPVSIGGLSRLTWFGAHNNLLTGTIPSAIGSLPSLETIDIHQNFLVGDLPPFTGAQIFQVWVYSNLLDGTLDEFFNSSSTNVLSILRFEDNLFSGPVPETVGNFLRMLEIDLTDNSLVGSIPTTFGNLVELDFLRLNNASFTGGIPSELGRLTKVETLDLGVNDLGGTVPTELANCRALVQLGVARAGLTGLFPQDLANLPRLELLLVQGNNFTNDFNATFCTRQDPIDRMIANCLVETVVCPCCTDCCFDTGIVCVAQ